MPFEVFTVPASTRSRLSPDLSAASLSTPYTPSRGCDGASPWAWNVLYSVIVKFATRQRRANAERRGLQCGIPWRWKSEMQLDSNWTRKNDQRPCHRTVVETTIFADDTTLHGHKRELYESDHLGA